jgi:hypothetical protein
MAKRKQKLYWYLITWTNPDADSKCVPGRVGTVIGLECRKEHWEGMSRAKRDFIPSARLAFLGAVPADYHENYPGEASRRIDLWKARYLKEHPIDGVS